MRAAARPEGGTERLLHLVARCGAASSKDFKKRLLRMGVAFGVWRVLDHLATNGTGRETVSGLAGVCLLQQPTMTKLLDRMVRGGLVRRTPDRRDRRVVQVSLTPTGERLAADLGRIAGEHEAALLAHVPAEAVASLRETLDAISAGPR